MIRAKPASENLRDLASGSDSKATGLRDLAKPSLRDLEQSQGREGHRRRPYYSDEEGGYDDDDDNGGSDGGGGGGYASDGSWRRRTRKRRGAGKWRDRAWVRRLGSQTVRKLEDAFFHHAVRKSRGAGRRPVRVVPVSRLSSAFYFAGRRVGAEELNNWRAEWGIAADGSLTLVQFVRAYADIFDSGLDAGDVGDSRLYDTIWTRRTQDLHSTTAGNAGTSKLRALAQEALPTQATPPVPVLAARLFAEFACATCGGSGFDGGYKCDKCRGEGIMGGDGGSLLRRLAVGRTTKQVNIVFTHCLAAASCVSRSHTTTPGQGAARSWHCFCRHSRS